MATRHGLRRFKILKMIGFVRLCSFLQILVQFRVEFGDILVPGGVSGVVLAALGRPGGDSGRPVSIFDRFGITCGGPSGSLSGQFWHHISKSVVSNMIVGYFL